MSIIWIKKGEKAKKTGIGFQCKEGQIDAHVHDELNSTHILNWAMKY